MQFVVIPLALPSHQERFLALCLSGILFMLSHLFILCHFRWTPCISLSQVLLIHFTRVVISSWRTNKKCIFLGLLTLSKGEYDDFLPMIVFRFLSFHSSCSRLLCLSAIWIVINFLNGILHITELTAQNSKNEMVFSDVKKINSSNIMQFNESVKKLIRLQCISRLLSRMLFSLSQKNKRQAFSFMRLIRFTFVFQHCKLISQSKNLD